MRQISTCRGLGLAAAAALLGLTGGTHAQTPPDAGSLLRETQQGLQPRALPTLPPILLPSEETPPAAGFRIFVRDFRIARAKLFPESELKALLAEFIGRELSFAELQKAAIRISEHYRQKGYFARAVLPRQTIQDGIVEIVVLEGRLGGIDIEQAPDARLDKQLARDIVLAQQKIGEPLRPEDAQRGLRLLNELPGVQAQATLVSGKNEGESNLVVKTTDGPLLSGMGLFDNQGVKATGTWRATANLAINNPSGQGDQATLLGLAGENNTYLRAGYSFRLGLDGLRLGANVSQLDYKLGGAFAAGSDGSAESQGLSLAYPLLRNTVLNLTGGINYDRKHLVSNLAGVNSSDKRAEVWNFVLSGDRVDTLFGGGINQFNVNVNLGDVRMENAGEIAADDAGPKSRGGYTKLALGASRLQKLGEASGLFLNLTGQLAGKNLDSSEKFSLGGPNGIRAYPLSEATGDEGWMLNAEVRHAVGEELQFVAFLDTGGITINKHPWAGWNAATPNKPARYDLAGAGIGVNYSKRNDYMLRLTLAAPFGNNPGRDASGNDSDGRSDSFRGWVQLIKFF